MLHDRQTIGASPGDRCGLVTLIRPSKVQRFMTFSCSIPAVPTVQLDDEDVRITRWDFAPGAATGWHLHGWPYFVIMIIGGILRVHNGTEVSETDLAQGQAYNRPSGIEHDVMNGSPHPIAFVEIEIKRPAFLGAGYATGS